MKGESETQKQRKDVARKTKDRGLRDIAHSEHIEAGGYVSVSGAPPRPLLT